LVQGGIHYQSGERPSFGFRLNWQAPGCPTFRDSRKVGTADLDPMFIRHSQPPGFMLHPIHAQPAPSLLGAGYSHFITTELLPRPAMLGSPRKWAPASPCAEHVPRSVVFSTIKFPFHVTNNLDPGDQKRTMNSCAFASQITQPERPRTGPAIRVC